MRPEDRDDYVERYRARLREHGYSPQTLGWGVNGRQEVRFALLGELALRDPTSSVLDVGCGFADLHDFLHAAGWKGRYTGVDIMPDLLQVARERHPGLDLRELDIVAEGGELQEHDFVIASGVFNAQLKVGDNQSHVRQALRAMHHLARRAVCVDFMSSWVDFQKPGAWHTDPSWALAEARVLSRRLELRLDYMPFEFALVLYRDDSVSPRRVFQGFERTLLPDG
jgi:SAM-dependent methyltransferase